MSAGDIIALLFACLSAGMAGYTLIDSQLDYMDRWLIFLSYWIVSCTLGILVIV